MRSVLVVALAACSSSSSAPDPSPPKPAPVGEPLAKGKPLEGAITSTEVKRYAIELPANTVARGIVMQKGVDLLVTAFDPSGAKLAEFDSPNGAQGPEAFTIEGGAAGTYILEVKAFVEPGGSAKPLEGRYEARIDDMPTADEYAEIRAKDRIASPRILELWRAARRKDAAAVEKFWADLAGRAPIVEPYANDARDALVTFVFRSKAPYAAVVMNPDFRDKPMLRVGDSDLWYLTARMPADARVDYAFLPADGPPENYRPWRPDRVLDERLQKKVPDPNNRAMHFDMSRVELPGAKPQPYVAAIAGNPKGKVTEMRVASAPLHESRRVGVYTPPGHDAAKSYPLLIVFDGETYGLEPGAQIALPTILDNLIAAKAIPPIVAALVANQGTRDRDLTGSAPFSEFVATELVPKLRADFRAGLTPADTIVTGSSFGGLCATFTAFHHSDVIGNVLSQSGSYQFRKDSIGKDVPERVEGAWLTRDIAASAKLPLRFYLDAGVFEQNLLESNRHLRDVLVAKGYPVIYAEFSGGHDYWMWRGTISDGLAALLAK